MYCGYDLKFLTEDCFENFDLAESYYKQGNSRFQTQKSQIKKVLDGFALPNGNLDGTVIQKNWFPKINADIFISHSHSDKKTAIIFSEILLQCFNLTSFIDSCVWGNSVELLQIIDDTYCWNPGSETYNYQKRNFSTSHVHMMLSTALMMMMDNCECVFFLDTPNSVTTEDVIDRTKSPWIYAEINMSRLIKRHYPKRIHKIQDSLEKSLGRESLDFAIEYTLDKSHFTELTLDKFSKWGDLCKNLQKHSLDILYKMVPPITQE